MRALFLMLASALAAGAATPCEDVGNLARVGLSVLESDVIEGGKFKNFAALPAFCRITAKLTPTDDSDIRIEVWMPISIDEKSADEKSPGERYDWNGKLQSVGNGAWGGVISYDAMAKALAAGYAVASTDGGHQGNNPDFIAGHPEKVIDFSYRAVHEMTLAAKSIIRTYYGRGPDKSYFNGCSTGGRQAMAELQRYPEDYDGVIMGDPVGDTSRIQGVQLWFWQLFHKTPASAISPEKLALLHDAVMKSCDGLDRVNDGVLEDPTRCGFDPSDLLCENGDAPNCLTAAQVEAARQSYAGPTGAESGRVLYPGREWGSELGWLNHSGAEPSAYAVEVYKQMALFDPEFDYRMFDFERDVPRAQRNMSSTMDAADRNLNSFFARGGKLIHYHGWDDPGVPPQGSVNYYLGVAAMSGGIANIQNSYRLFMVPGMGHCGGGEGTSTFNMIDALEEWVENDRAPDWIPASRVVNGSVVRTRPLCPYPQVAAYRGSGSTDDAANFDCRVP